MIAREKNEVNADIIVCEVVVFYHQGVVEEYI